MILGVLWTNQPPNLQVDIHVARIRLIIAWGGCHLFEVLEKAFLQMLYFREPPWGTDRTSLHFIPPWRSWGTISNPGEIAQQVAKNLRGIGQLRRQNRFAKSSLRYPDLSLLHVFVGEGYICTIKAAPLIQLPQRRHAVCVAPPC